MSQLSKLCSEPLAANVILLSDVCFWLLYHYQAQLDNGVKVRALARRLNTASGSEHT